MKASAAQEEALARASIRDQIAYEHPEIAARLLPAQIGGGGEVQTLFERTQEAQRVYWGLLSDLENLLDVEIDGTSDLESTTLDELKNPERV